MKLPLIVLFIFITTAGANASVIHVPEDYPTLSQALTNASDGDTIVVNGTYNETLNIGKEVSIIGGTLGCTLEDYIWIKASNITLANLTVDTDGTAILVGYYSDPLRTNVSIEGCNIINSTDGMVIMNSEVNVSNTTISTSRYSIRPISSRVWVKDCLLQSDVFATDNGFFSMHNTTVYGKTSPIYLYNVNGEIEDALLTGEQSGVILRNSSSTLSNISFEGLNIGLYLLDSDGVRAESISATNCS
jgi:hypothetical protein